MRDAILAEKWTLLVEGGGQRFIDRRVAYRRSPSSVGNGSDGFTARKVANAEDDNSRGESDAGKNGSGDRSGVPIAGVRYEAGLGAL
jgi:hypothetical protein